MKITHIVPRFWPQFDGLGDYARMLGRHLQEESGIESRFLVGDPAWRASSGDFPDGTSLEITAVSQQTVAGLLERLQGVETVVLHYVGYGYHNRGIPFWINRAMKTWKQSSPAHRLIVVFHELWASGPPWKSECYLGWIQRRLVRELHDLCDLSVASVPLALRRLQALRRKETILHPVPCNMGSESGHSRKWHKGGPVRLALFGMPTQREISLKSHLRLVAALHEAGLVEAVNVIGKDARSGDDPSNEVRILRGILPEERIHIVSNATPERAGQALAESDLLLSFYPSRWLFKSGSSMAALANGAIPVLPEGRDLEILAEGREILVCSGEKSSIAGILSQIQKPGGLGTIARGGYDWYWAHADWPILTRKLAAALERLTNCGAQKNDKSRLATVGGTPLIPTQGRMEK
ncbi:MAG TPA: hypothetical protein VIM61_08195 [Chthoniobacterales bacterium]